MAPFGQSAISHSSCAAQQRLMGAIARLASLTASELESDDLSRLEDLISEFECPRHVPRHCLLQSPRSPMGYIDSAAHVGVFSPAFGSSPPVCMPGYASPERSHRPLESYSPGFLEHAHTMQQLGFPNNLYESDLSDTCTELSWASEDRVLDSLAQVTQQRYEDLKRLSSHATGTRPQVGPQQGSTCVGNPPSQCSCRPLSPTRPAQHNAQCLSSTVEVPVCIPHNHIEGTQLTIEYSGQMYAIAVPVGSALGSTFPVTLLVPQQNIDF